MTSGSVAIRFLGDRQAESLYALFYGCVDAVPTGADACGMSRLLALVDEYKDRHGQPSDSSIARAIGAKPQTISSWRTRGIKDPPSRELLRNLADFLHLDYETVVLRAALLDAGWITEEPPASSSGLSQTAG